MNQTDPSPNSPSHSSVIVSFFSFSGVGLICFFVFCLVRTHFKDIYSPRRVLKAGTPPRLPTGFLNWIPVVWNIPETFLISTVGLDAVMFLRFLKTGILLFTILTVFGLGVIAPVNYFSNSPEEPVFEKGKPFNEAKFIDRISITNVPFGSPLLNAHLFFTWLFTFIAYGCLIAYFRGHVQLKLKYGEHVLRKSKLQRIEQRTVMVYGIPKELRNEVDLAAYFESLDVGRVEQVVVCRRWSQLRRAVSLRAYYLNQIETVYSRIVKNVRSKTTDSTHRKCSPNQIIGFFFGCIRGNATAPSAPNPVEQAIVDSDSLPNSLFAGGPSEKALMELEASLRKFDPKYRPRHNTGVFGVFGEDVDSAEYYIKQFKLWDTKVGKLRKTADMSAPTTIGFVTFETPKSAVLASQIVIHSRPFVCKATMAPEPRDLYWANLSSKIVNPYLKIIRTVFVTAVLFVLVVFSVTIISSIVTPLSNLKGVADAFPWTKPFINALSPNFRKFLESVVSPVVLTAWTGSLPSVLLMLTQLQGLEAESWIDMELLSKYWFYQFFNYFLLPVTTGTLFNLFAELSIIFETPGKIIELLGKGVVDRAPQLVNYVMLLGLAVYPATLLLVAPLVLTWLFRLSPLSQISPRTTSDAYYPSQLTSMNYGIAYPLPTIVFIIGMTYAPIAPLILPFCLLFFLVAYGVFKYYFLYVHLPKYETGGMHAPIAVRRCLWGMWIMQLAVGGCLAIKSLLERTNDDSGMGIMLEGLKWSSYVQTVVLVLPLAMFNFGLMWWFADGYERLVKNLPLEIVANVTTEVKNATLSAPGATTASAGRWVVAAAAAFVGKKKADKWMARRRPSNARSEGSDNESESSAERNSLFEAHAAGSSTESLNSQHLVDPAVAARSLQTTQSEISHTLKPASTFSVMKNRHLEPPMTRVPGILDVPIESATPIVSESDFQPLWQTFSNNPLPSHSSTSITNSASGSQLFNTETIRNETSVEIPTPESESLTDLVLLSYLHPALIGRLPTFWLKTNKDYEEQPPSLVESREYQAIYQRDLWKRIVLQQRVGVNEMKADHVQKVAKASIRRKQRRERREELARLQGEPVVDDLDDFADSTEDEEEFDSREEEELDEENVGEETGLLQSRSLRKQNKKNSWRKSWRNSAVYLSVKSLNDGVSSWANLKN